MKLAINQSELEAAMEEARQMAMPKTYTTMPPGYFTSHQYAAMCGISINSAGRQLDALAKNGKLDKIRVYCPLGTGHYRRGVAYGHIKKKGKA